MKHELTQGWDVKTPVLDKALTERFAGRNEYLISYLCALKRRKGVTPAQRTNIGNAILYIRQGRGFSFHRGKLHSFSARPIKMT